MPLITVSEDDLPAVTAQLERLGYDLVRETDKRFRARRRAPRPSGISRLESGLGSYQLWYDTDMEK